ncbi:MAG: RNA methyltransferase, partial [Bacillus sp. (in: Bacteria)]|nr:RNA methyltransferase [Bacillus sp. (in: firmicutes)]
MKYIESAKNAHIKQWKKLHTKKERTKTGLFLVEGKHLVEEALKSGVVKELMITTPDMLPADIEPDIELYELSEEAFTAMTETETPQQIAAVCTIPVFEEKKYERMLLLDAVQDPGNLGTLIRTADAAGLDAVILGDGTVDAFNGKTLRSAQGSHFHLPILKQTLQQTILIKQLEAHPFSAQTFLPLDMAPSLIVVCDWNGTEGPDVATLKAFIAQPNQIVTYHRGVLHHRITPL